MTGTNSNSAIRFHLDLKICEEGELEDLDVPLANARNTFEQVMQME